MDADRAQPRLGDATNPTVMPARRAAANTGAVYPGRHWRSFGHCTAAPFPVPPPLSQAGLDPMPFT